MGFVKRDGSDLIVCIHEDVEMGNDDRSNSMEFRTMEWQASVWAMRLEDEDEHKKRIPAQISIRPIARKNKPPLLEGEQICSTFENVAHGWFQIVRPRPKSSGTIKVDCFNIRVYLLPTTLW